MTTNKKHAKKSTPAPPPAKPKARTSATAAAILGKPITGTARKPANGALVKIKPEWQKYYENLLELRERLLAQMNGLAKESAEEMAGYSLHMADSGTDNFDRDFALSLLSSDQDAIYEIEEALKRIEKNTYGVCELTGKTIPKAVWMRFPGPASPLKPRLNSSAKALCASAVSALWARSTAPAPSKSKKRTKRKRNPRKKRNNSFSVI